MKAKTAASLIVLLITALASFGFADSAKDETATHDTLVGKNAVEKTNCDLSCFTWLSGTWQMTHAGMTIQEVWMNDSSGCHGLSITLKGADTLEVEKMWLMPTDSGFYFVAAPSQNPEPTLFKLISSDSMRFVFENPTHDFPQRVIYHLVAQDTLQARIEGTGKDGQEQGMTFPYVRMRTSE